MHNSPGKNREPLPPTDKAIDAAIRLLADDQRSVVDAARNCLREFGDRARVQLLAAAETGEPAVRVRARELLRALEVRRLLRRLVGLDLDRSGSKKPEALLTGAVFSAQMVRTFTKAAPELSRMLRQEARYLRPLMKGRSLPMCARLLSDHLTGVLGLKGAKASALELDHVLIDRVLEQKIGVPVALSLIWLIVARWAGLSVCGVAMPDHFLIRVHGRRPVLIDPFHAGRQVTKVDCIRYLKRLGHRQLMSHMRDLTDREMLMHYLRAVRRAAAARGRDDAQESLRDAIFQLEVR